jgi:hypothetical protein
MPPADRSGTQVEVSVAAPIPQKLQTVAGVQIVSGLLNLFVMGGLVTSVLFTILGGGGSVIALCTPICPFAALGPCVSVCGFWGLGLLPIGMLEIVCGAVTLANPDGAKTFAKIGMVTELASLLFGGLTSFAAGMIVRNLLEDPEVKGFLEGGGTTP